jgi:hypothetical protein
MALTWINPARGRATARVSLDPGWDLPASCAGTGGLLATSTKRTIAR